MAGKDLKQLGLLTSERAVSNRLGIETSDDLNDLSEYMSPNESLLVVGQRAV